MKKTIIIPLLLILGGCISSQSQIPIMEHFDTGPYGVGFKHEVLTDFSRAYGNAYRPVRLFVWYPSEEKSKTPLWYSDYFLLDRSEGEAGKADTADKNKRIDTLVREEIESLKENLKKTGIKFSEYKALKTIAQEGVPVAGGSFPLIIFAPGGNTAGHLHAVMCEYLASYGYIVVSIPSLGNGGSRRWPFDQTGLNLHIDDMAFAMNHLKRTMEPLHIEKTGLISWSVGGISQGIFCMKNPGIDMLISLDSGLGRVYGIEMLKGSPYFNYERFKIPYLHITGKQPEIYQVERSSEFYDSIPSPQKASIVIEAFAHQHFAAQKGIIPALASENEDKAIIENYVKMCRLSLAFINAYLKDEPGAELQWRNMIKDHNTD